LAGGCSAGSPSQQPPADRERWRIHRKFRRELRAACRRREHARDLVGGTGCREQRKPDRRLW